MIPLLHTKEQFSATILQQLCDELDEPRVIIKAVSPRFEVVAFNELFVQVSQTWGQELRGKSMAELQAWKSDNEDGAIQIYEALLDVIQTKQIVCLPAVRYDLQGQDGTFKPCWWQAIYEPLINAEGTVEYLLCTTINVTEQMVKQP